VTKQAALPELAEKKKGVHEKGMNRFICKKNK
jgi:hypothetical protein